MCVMVFASAPNIMTPGSYRILGGYTAVSMTNVVVTDQTVGQWHTKNCGIVVTLRTSKLTVVASSESLKCYVRSRSH